MTTKPLFAIVLLWSASAFAGTCPALLDHRFKTVQGQEMTLCDYGVDFPMIEKSSVKGASANALFKDLTRATGQAPGWNFHKYLIAPGAKQVYRFATSTEPDASEVMTKLRPMLR